MTVITASPTQFGKLLNLQSEQLNQLKTGTADQLEQLSGIRENTAQAKEQAIQIQANKIAEDTNEKIKDLGESIKKKLTEDAKAINEIAAGMKTFKTIGDRLNDKKQGMKDKFGSLSGILDTFGIVKKNSGGIISDMLGKSEEQKKFIKQQKILGSTDSDAVLKGKFKSAQKTSKEIQKNEANIKEFTDAGMSEEALRNNKGTAGLLQKRGALAREYATHDLKAKIMASNGESDSEKQEEAARASEEQTDILKKIAENTTADGKGKTAATVEKPKEGGGLLDTIMGFLGDGFMSAIKTIFSPKMMFKAISKVFAPLMLIGSLINGIMDGFKEFQESGDIGKALIAGLGGVLEFLSFGLIDKKTLTNIIESVSGFVNDYIVQPLSDFFKSVKDNVLALVESIGIPAITIPMPAALGGDRKIGPFYPFKSDSKATPPTAPPPTAAAQVEQQSAENAGAGANGGGGNTTAVVATNVSNTTKQTNIIKSPVRNQDSTMNRYVNSRYA